MLLSKQKKNDKGNRLLVSITVMGSAGPIRFVVNEKELVASVMDTALKSYAREGRLPLLGSNLDHFVLYCPIAGTEALSPWETIGSFGVRNFMLCKKPGVDNGKQVRFTCTGSRESTMHIVTSPFSNRRSPKQFSYGKPDLKACYKLNTGIINSELYNRDNNGVLVLRSIQVKII